MENHRLAPAIIGTITTWLATVWAAFKANSAAIAAFFAVLASLFTIWSAIQSGRLARAKRQRIERESKLTDTDVV